MNKIHLLGNLNTIKLRMDYEWSILILDKNILFEYIFEFLMDNENLFFYASQKYSTKTLEETRKHIKKLIDSEILDQEIMSIFSSIGWEKNKIDYTNTVFQGDLAEYLMCILIDKFTNISSIISKVSLKTSPSMPSYGNDNIFYDFIDKVLYLGEAKFYSSSESALNQAIISLNKHSGITEIQYIKNHTNNIISENNEKRTEIVEKFESIAPTDVVIKSIIFIISDDVYEKKDFEKILITKFSTQAEIDDITSRVLFVFLPILSKIEFLKYFKDNLI